MFVKTNRFVSRSKQFYDLLKRDHSTRMLNRQMEKNPHMKQILEQQTKKTKSQGVLQRLIDKRTAEFNEYFSHSPEQSIVKRPKHVSYDHVGQKRAKHLCKVLRAFVADRIGSGEIGDVLAGKNFQITNIVIPVDLNRIEILWWSPEQDASTIEELLKNASDNLRTAIRHAQLLPNLPPIVFKRDDLRLEHDHINHLIDTADKGIIDENSPGTTVTNAKPNERTDLYDSDRTVILQKLSDQTSIDEKPNETNDEPMDMNQLTVAQIQRRMKAFALTKRMKRVQEQRNAMYGIMAIEKEQQNQEHFSLSRTTDFDFEHAEKEKSS